ncbi:MAG: Gfo/Idh/MocA family oxidoreductase [Chloroflexota bacterium]|nr:Gfo/Idh/MocA family oxidoreductase [Chloroflexota bacterium]
MCCWASQSAGEGARATAERFGISRWTDDYRTLLDDPAIDIVDILAPNYLHSEMTIAAARAGKHVICIKPLAINMRQVEEMDRALAESGLRFFYVENVPFIPALEKAQSVIEEGALGEVFRLKACGGIGMPPNKWAFDPEKSGGAIIDMAAHGIAFCRWMAGAEAESVYAQAGTFLHQDKTTNEDTAVIVIRFKNGVIGQCEDSWSLAGAMDSRFEVFGTAGRILIDNLHRQPVQVVSEEGYAYWGGPKASGKGWTYPLPLPGDIIDGQYAMLENFIDCLREGTPSRSEFADGRAIQSIVDAAYHSLESGKSELVEPR